MTAPEILAKSLEDELVALLLPLRERLGATVRAWASTASLREVAEGAARPQLPRLPAVLVMLGRRDNALSGVMLRQRWTWVVLVADQSLRELHEAVAGGPRNPGCYALLEGVQQLLCGRRVTAGGLLQPGREYAVSLKAELAMYASEWTVSTEVRTEVRI